MIILWIVVVLRAYSPYYKKLSVDCLVTGQDDGAVDVILIASTRQIIDRSSETLQNGAHSFGASDALHEFISDVANTQVGEHKHVGVTCDVAGEPCWHPRWARWLRRLATRRQSSGWDSSP